MNSIDFLAELPMLPDMSVLGQECLVLSQLLVLTGALLVEKGVVDNIWPPANPDDEDDTEQYPHQHEAMMVPTANKWFVYWRNKPHELMIGFAISPTGERWEHTYYGQELLYVRPESQKRFQYLVTSLQEKREAFLRGCPRVSLQYAGYYLLDGAVYHESDETTQLYRLCPDNTLSHLLADPHRAAPWWYPGITVYNVLSIV
ncbi:MAG TPA: hypothetical protein VNG90_00605 [Candidatus Acidoferrum sp.]|nr:hypothetical protein [Candidatus Acidoferrum sp.]